VSDVPQGDTGSNAPAIAADDVFRKFRRLESCIVFFPSFSRQTVLDAD
jgi:hypothetical protein